ncbi:MULTISPECIES: DUF4286 family protein [unclassified Microbacterium]|uniref:DUF4286 family protein n=1 Tax=unclassified Microbacterium TaxID=2609290 RepID=UPI00214AAC5B|nr:MULTISPECIES: DUF4286 family protein [unclassified Microbacterium]MCR2811381.1 hypothetical protein [Microbacterium sp. zg.B185]WIM19573.1 hypothetical protein QNO12_01830 [Microbacterium sp. zg-B185]
MSEPAVLFLRVPPISADRAEEYESWYDTIHIPYRMKIPGFAGAQRWECVSGHPRYFVFYELDSVDAMAAPEYLALRRWEAEQPADSFEGPGSSRPGFERGVYEQRHGVSWPEVPENAGAILIVGYTPDDSAADAFVDWLDGAHVPLANAVPGVEAVRIMQLTAKDLGPEAGMRTERPSVLTIYYLADLDIAQSDKLTAIIHHAREQVGSDTEPYELLGRRVFTISRT